MAEKLPYSEICGTEVGPSYKKRRLSALSEQKRVNMIVKDNFTIVCWFDSGVDECLARRLAEYVFDQLMMFLGEEDLNQLDQSQSLNYILSCVTGPISSQ